MSAAQLLDQVGLGGPIKFGPGRRAAPIQMAFDRELSVEELLQAQSSELVQKVPFIQKLRQSHHQIARLLAEGISNVEVAAITGKQPAWISSLKSDPGFSNLLDYYVAMEKERFEIARADMTKRLSSLGFDSVEELHDRLNEKPESFTNKELLLVIEATADRTGHGKTSTVNHEHQHSLSPETIARVKQNAGVSYAPAPTDREALLRLAAGRTAEQLSEAQAADWIEGEGHLVREEDDQALEGEVAARDATLPQVD